ncbi:MAG: acyltransferase [Deltaproteobacteria bacterium]|nr:acyltransferase [Deltaproteobacteria bacterium]MBW2218302.1 acyltransferase [Deltaproteobacteria bacterium]
MRYFPEPVKGVLTFLLITVNTAILAPTVIFLGVVKLVLPLKSFYKIFAKINVMISERWIGNNAFIVRLMHKIQWEVQGLDTLKRRSWYLVVSNHQSWVDILVLQTIFHRRIPFLKFFLKKELIWVPIMGLVWWALDFPFMKRYSQEFLKKNPHLKGKDIEITRKACEKFKANPISVMNFVEGTRFTDAKHKKQQSPHSHLLKPKAGGVAFVFGAMGDYLDSILNVTIAYPQGIPTFWDFLCGRVNDIMVRVEPIPITDELLGDYYNDPEYRARFQGWVNDLWAEKDKTVSNLLDHHMN